MLTHYFITEHLQHFNSLRLMTIFTSVQSFAKLFIGLPKFSVVPLIFIIKPLTFITIFLPFPHAKRTFPYAFVQVVGGSI